VPLNAEVRQALKNYLNQRPKVTHAALFVGQKGEPLGKQGIQYQIKMLAARAKLEDVSAHTLRHTFAKSLIDVQVSLDQVATLMGHSSLTTTARYTKPSQQDLARAVEKLGGE
jgi:integrase/recombinase XerC